MILLTTDTQHTPRVPKSGRPFGTSRFRALFGRCDGDRRGAKPLAGRKRARTAAAADTNSSGSDTTGCVTCTLS